MRKFTILLLFALSANLVIGFQSCQTSKSSTASRMLRFNLEKGKGYDYETTVNLDQEIMGQKIQMDMTTYYSMTVDGEEGDVKTINTSIDRFKMNSSAAGFNLDIDTDKPYNADAKDTSELTNSLSMLHKVFGAIKGQRFGMKVNAEGKITDVTGFENMAKSLVDSLDLPEDQRAQITAEFNKQFNGDQIKEQLERFWFLFPNKEVKVGDTWEKNSELSGAMGGNYKSTYKVSEIEGDMVTLEEKTKVASKQESVNIDGDIQGTIIVDSRLGLVVSGTQDMKMKASSQGMSFDIVGKTKIKGKARQ